MARRRSQGTAAPRRRQAQPPANKAMPDSSRGVCPARFPSRARSRHAAVPGAGPPLPHAGMAAAFPAATARQPAPRAPPIPGASPSPAIARGRRPPAPTDGPACGGSLPQPISPAWAAKPCKAVEKTSRRFFETRRQAAPIEARVPVFVRRMRLRRLPGAPQSRRAHKNQNPGAARQRAAPGQARYRAGLSSSRSGSRRTPSDARRPGTPRAPWAPRR